jgi:hypothetical protein
MPKLKFQTQVQMPNVNFFDLELRHLFDIRLPAAGRDFEI